MASNKPSTVLIKKLNEFLPSLATSISKSFSTIIGSSVIIVFDVLLEVIFSIYILANKEKFVEYPEEKVIL